MKELSQHITFVFDLDNTLVETNFANNLSYMAAVKKVINTDMDIDFNQRFTRDKLYACFPNLTERQYKHIIAAKNESFYAHMKQTTLNSNLANLLRVLHLDGRNTILLTDCRKQRATLLCAYHGLTPFFSESYFFEDKVDTKYDVLTRRGYDLNSIVLFENETQGKAAAISNGIPSENIIKVTF